MIIARCLECDGEFSEEDIAGKTACPKCAAQVPPVDPKNDVTVKLNWHELRILGCFADNWAREKCGPRQVRTLAGIFDRLEAQHPGRTPLSLAREVREIQADHPNATLLDGSGNPIVPPKDAPS